MDFDTSWCPVCDRQILPKRYQVPVYPNQPQQPTITAPPSSPSSSSPSKVSDAPTVRRKAGGGTIRARAGLVHGTGRVKPNGHLKRSDSSTKQPIVPTPAPAKTATPVRHRTVIDQGPIPLYCSDECKAADIASSCGIGSDFDPRRERLSSTPHNTVSSSVESESESLSSSTESQSSSSSRSSTQPSKMSPSMATLAKLYNFPPLPPPAPIFDEASSSDSELNLEYNSGIMMANRRIQAALCPKPAKRNPLGTHIQPEPPKPIPGWTDGSNAWRAAVYSFAAPTDLSKPCDPIASTATARAYGSFVASPHRARSNNCEASSSRVPFSISTSPSSRAQETLELYTKYSDSLSRRAELRTPTSQLSTSGSSSSSRRRERPLLAPGAEGKLLVPNVTLKRRTSSSTSVSVAATRKSLRSPLVRSESYGDASEEDVATPSTETRSWSYDNFKTYPVMEPPPRKEKRIETRIVDGQEVQVEIEVEVPAQLKRLFLFPGS